jgi:hypothetical protein
VTWPPVAATAITGNAEQAACNTCLDPRIWDLRTLILGLCPKVFCPKKDLGELLRDFNGGEMEAEMASVAAAAVGKSEGNPSALSTAMPFSL